MKQVIGGYVNFMNGDELAVRGRVMAHVKINHGIVTIECHDDIESSIYIGNMTTDPSKHIDDAINCVWSGLSIGLTWNK